MLVMLLAAMISTTLALGPSQYRAEDITGDYWTWWVFETVLSLEADVFGAIILVVFTKWFYEKRSAEAKEPPNNE